MSKTKCLTLWLLSITCWDLFHSLRAADLVKEGDSSVCPSLAPQQTSLLYLPLWGLVQVSDGVQMAA